MATILHVPIVYKEKEWQTLISVCRIDDVIRLRVNILNSRLASKLASNDVFVLKKGELQVYPENEAGGGDSALLKTLQNTLQKYLIENKVVFE
jgi:hypothetical protein